MEQIYKPKNDQIISVRQAFAEFRQELLPPNLMPRVPFAEEDIAEAIGFTGSNNQFNDLLQSIDLDLNLSSTKDMRVVPFHPSRVLAVQKQIEVPEKARKFRCVQNALRITGRIRKNLDTRIRYNKHKYTESPPLEDPDLDPFSEMLLQIRFYEPFKYKTGVRLGHPKFHQEFYVIGSQTLAELRDKVYCHCDSGPFFDISDNPHQPERKRLQDEANPGFFFIHDTFYNDMRNDRNMDYSEVIRKWAERQKCVGELKCRKMEETRFDDLRFRLGYPQVYQHHGNCEHIFLISDCRLLSPTDILTRKRYPILNSYVFPRSIPCNICGHCEANFIVKNSDQHIFDPAYVCQACFESYHYKDGKKIGEFEAYQFLGTKVAVKDDEPEVENQ